MKLKISGYYSRFLALVLLAVFCGCQKQTETVPAPPAKPAIVSAEKTSFDSVAAKLNPGGNFYLYLSTEQALAGLSDKLNSLSNLLGSIPDLSAGQQQTGARVMNLVSAWVKNSGIEQISGFGMSSIAREPGVYFTKSVLHHYPGQGSGLLWNIMGQTPHALTDLDLLPDTTTLAFFMDFNVPMLWTNIEAQLRQVNNPEITSGLDQWPVQFHKLTGLDFDQALNSLGGDYGLILTLDEQKKISMPWAGQTVEIPSPGLAFVAKVKSDLIFDRADALMKSNPLVVKVDKADLRMRTMNIPLPLPLDLHPTVARLGDYLIIASSDAMVQDIAAVKAGTKKGFKSTEIYKKLSPGMPNEANNFSVLTPAFSAVMMQIQEQLLARDRSGLASFQRLLSNTNAASLQMTVNGPEGWEGFANGTQSIQAMIVPAMVGVAGMMAGIAIPNFVKARGTSQYNTIINNLRLIDAAKQQWALENHKEIGNTPTMDDLKTYLGHFKPIAGEEYIINALGTLPTAKLTQEINGHPAGSEITLPQ